MLESGDEVDLSEINGLCVDKHSTGGVGDKTSLVIAPICASFGLKLAKMSGRGLGHTGGTLDKLESIPGLTISLSLEDFIKQVNEIGLAIIGQTANVAPADKKLYALRDVTGTVDSIGLIASSIMSKKLASGAKIILLDVKVGDGAFMKTLDDARVLAKRMVNIGKRFGRKVVAMITDMDQPLGNAVGNSIEVIEAIDTLKGNGPKDFTELCYNICAEMLTVSEVFTTKEEALIKIDEIVLHQVCRKLKSWKEKGYSLHPISVNLSRKHLEQTNVAEHLTKIVDSYGLDHQYIEFELTESATNDNQKYMLSILQDLHNKGFLISMDDFGTGYSSFGLLKEMPLDTLKIDKSFVDFIAVEKEPNKNKIILQHIISMANALGIHCIAEGAEYYEQIKVLENLGCNTVQGFYYSKPIPMEDFEENYISSN